MSDDEVVPSRRGAFTDHLRADVGAGFSPSPPEDERSVNKSRRVPVTERERVRISLRQSFSVPHCWKATKCQKKIP